MDMIVVAGRVELMMDDEDFARILDNYLGDEAADYFRDAIKDRVDEQAFMNDPAKYCPFKGECDAVISTQEHFENLLKECADLAREIYDGIMAGYHIGGRRTKKEQLALDKAIQIMKVVKKNT